MPKTEGEKTYEDRMEEAKYSGANAWAFGRPCDPSQYTSDPMLQALWRQAWLDEENKQRERRGEGAVTFYAR